MKYQHVVMSRRISPERSELRQFYFPVEFRDGKWMPCGPLIPEPTADDPIDLMGAVSDYEEGAGADCGPLSDITPLEGWTVDARLWHPDDYVPPSREVVDEDDSRARKHLRELGFDT
jgi:hypothetical protein